MKGILLVVCAFLIASAPAQAESFLKRFGRALDEAGKNLQRELEENSRPTPGEEAGAALERRAGLCLAIARGGQKLFEKRCTAEKSCTAQQDCKIAYRWPPRDHMEAKWGSGTPLTFIGLAAEPIRFEGHSCLAIRNKTTIFCFVDDNHSAAPLMPFFTPLQRQASRPDTDADQPVSKEEATTATNPDNATSSQTPVERKETETALAAEAQSRAAEAARRDAEVKANLIAELTDDADIDWFFKDKTQSTLAPVDAAQACQDYFMSRIVAVASPAPVDAVQGMRTRCAKKAQDYGRRSIEREAEHLAEPILKAPATLESLQQNDWFKFKPVRSKSFTIVQQSQIEIAWEKAVRAHRDTAIRAAESEIRQAFKKAVPLTASADTAWQLCALKNGAPSTLVELCAAQREDLNRRIKVARCDHAVSQSGASRKLLDLRFEYTHRRYGTSTLRHVICAGIANHRDYRIAIGNGSIPYFTAPSFEVYDAKGRKLLDLALRISTRHDGRSFFKLLVDIATGENEKPVKETLVIDKVRYVASTVTWRDDPGALSCVLGFLKCN